MVALPPFVYYLWICATFYGGALVWPTSWLEWRELVAHVPGLTFSGVALYVGWFALQAALQAAMPGKQRMGMPLSNGTRLTYRMNGWWSFVVTLAVVGALVWGGVVPATLFYDQFGTMLTAANVFTFGLALFLYWHGKRNGQTTRWHPAYEYFMGTELNPRSRSFDWKLFCEARPGLILWIIIDFSMMAKQYQLNGFVSVPMIMVCAFQLFYVVDYFWHEDAILTTWDIKHEKFGWMLAWGDLVWVPFTYTLQALYLVNHTHELSVWAIVGIVALNLAGYAMFRGANIQKHRFRLDPSRPVWGKPPEFIQTAAGNKLLVSGWWGKARHVNYLGDLMHAWSWSLPCGFMHVLPYFYPIYFTILLVHRERRDDAMCHAKYGSDWDRYRERVPWRIVPGVY